MFLFYFCLFLGHAFSMHTCSMQYLSSPTRYRTCAPCLGNRVLTTGLPGKSSIIILNAKKWSVFNKWFECMSKWMNKSFRLPSYFTLGCMIIFYKYITTLILSFRNKERYYVKCELLSTEAFWYFYLQEWNQLKDLYKTISHLSMIL